MAGVLLSLSGGADSATLLARYCRDEHAVEATFFDYGSKQNPIELRASQGIAARYGVRLHVFDVRGVFKGFASAMLADDARPIPPGGYGEGVMQQTVVPGRNTIFAAILAGLAESRGIATIALGIHGGDHHLYPDCRPDYAAALGKTIALSSGGAVSVEAPFITMNKAQIIALGLSLGVPYELTRSCYAAEDVACGRCGTCLERREAFRANGVEDPLPYASEG